MAGLRYFGHSRLSEKRIKLKNRIKNAISNEPLGVIGLAVAILSLVVAIIATVPAYLNRVEQQNYTFLFNCTEIGPANPAMVVEGPALYDFVALHTRCDFSNLDNQTISLKEISIVGWWEGAPDYAYIFDRPIFGPMESLKFGLPIGSLPAAIPPGESFLFDEFFLIPIRKDWYEDNEWCSPLLEREVRRLWELSNCIREVRNDRLLDYIQTIDFPAGAGGSHPFRDFGVRITLTNNEIVDEHIKYGWTFRKR